MRGTVPANVPTTKVVQFTDIHMDLHYKDGGNSDCGSGIPICCRESDGLPANEDVKAGKYGHWMCALPMETTEEMFKNARDQHSDAKYIFVTGDYIHSGVWLYNKDENLEHISRVTQSLAEVYRGVPASQAKIYPLTGNHEPHVVNLYAPPDLWEYKDTTFDLRWMYSAVMENFLARDPDLISAEEQERFLTHGYYVAFPEPGLRILAINTNLAYGENFWLGYAPLDPGHQLQWMADELWKAEENGDKVIIIGHEEPGSCWKFWSGAFNQIVDRFEGTIMGQFYGHSHRPQFRLAFRNGTLTPASASFIAGSALTDSGNPSYSVFHLDGKRDKNSTWNVVKQELITLKLQESNKAGVPLFEKLVDTQDSFGLDDLTPASIFEFAKKLICDQELMDNYMLYHHRGADSRSYNRCMIDDSCREGHLCNMVASNALDSTACEYLKQIINTFDCQA